MKTYRSLKITLLAIALIMITTFTIALIIYDESKDPPKGNVQKWKQEIVDTEAAFAQMVQEQGMNRAFVAFAADEAVLMRGNQLIVGKEEIQKFMENQTSRGLSWKPEHVDVSTSGDLGYTYGYYTFVYQDSTGTNMEAQGVFHSVWKRQEDGSWKFVWD